MRNNNIPGKNNHKLVRLIAGGVGGFLFFYFLFYMISGERGLISLIKLKRQLSVSQSELSTLTKEREQVENRVKLMRDESLDKDMLEERARVMLNYSKPGEIIIPSENLSANNSLPVNNTSPTQPLQPNGDQRNDRTNNSYGQ